MLTDADGCRDCLLSGQPRGDASPVAAELPLCTSVLLEYNRSYFSSTTAPAPPAPGAGAAVEVLLLRSTTAPAPLAGAGAAVEVLLLRSTTAPAPLAGADEAVSSSWQRKGTSTRSSTSAPAVAPAVEVLL
jgi:hypothetical protein